VPLRAAISALSVDHPIDSPGVVALGGVAWWPWVAWRGQREAPLVRAGR
jgi:hypothetical protein